MVKESQTISDSCDDCFWSRVDEAPVETLLQLLSSDTSIAIIIHRAERLFELFVLVHGLIKQVTQCQTSSVLVTQCQTSSVLVTQCQTSSVLVTQCQTTSVLVTQCQTTSVLVTQCQTSQRTKCSIMCGVTVLPCQKSTAVIGEESDCGKYRQAG